MEGTRLRWSLFLIGAVFTAGGAFLALATHHERAENLTQIENRFGEVLLRGNKVASERLERQVHLAEDAIQESLHRSHKRESVDNALLVNGMPRFILSAEHRVRAPDFFIEDELLAAAQKSLKSADHFSLANIGDKHYLLLLSTKKVGDAAIGVFDLESFFSFLRTADSTAHWIALRNAQILYHSEARFIGAEASNLKPLADALQILSQGRGSAQVSSFLNLESSEAFGATATLPALGIVLGSEWTHFSAAADGSNEFISTIALFFLSAGFFIFGLSIRPARKDAPELQMFDESRLDADAMEYLESARKAAEVANRLVLEKDEIIKQLELTLGQESWKQREADWRFETMKNFMERVADASSGKQVWRELAKLIVDRLPGSSAIVYRYSSTSFSLVPDFSIGLDVFEESAKRYLNDARIFLGALPELAHLDKTQAFKNWDRQRTRYMRIHDVNMQFLPFGDTSSNSGCISVILERSLNENSVNQDYWEFFHLLIRYASCLYDSRQPLLQSKNEKRDWTALAGSPDQAGNKPARA